jgi:hypothetical protein
VPGIVLATAAIVLAAAAPALFSPPATVLATAAIVLAAAAAMACGRARFPPR